MRILLAALLCLSLSAHADILTGRVIKVADGDTVTILDNSNNQHKIRLSGIDAPEKKQAFGSRSQQSLSEMVAGKTVSAAEIIRDKYGRIARSKEAVREFKMQHPCPANGLRFGRCPGYIVDHVTALACGGLDAPQNMQWQSIEDAKAKDKWERKGC